jgi:hypothetical protein
MPADIAAQLRELPGNQVEHRVVLRAAARVLPPAARQPVLLPWLLLCVGTPPLAARSCAVAVSLRGLVD